MRASIMTAKKEIKEAWLNGVRIELDFWDRWFATKGLEWNDDYTMRMAPESKLQDFFLPYINKNLKKIKILDVGAGPLTYVNKKCERCKIEIHACDVLAREYNKIIKKYNIHPAVRTKRLDTIELHKKYPENTFDISYARNCVDHSYDPFKSIDEMIKVTKLEGFIILHHVFKEGSSTGWPGFHLWDIFFKGKRIFIQGKNSKRRDITEIFKKRIKPISIFCEGKENMFVVVFKKIGARTARVCSR